MNTLDTAIHFALTMHHGKVNHHDDEPYVLHLHRVAILIREHNGDEDQQAIAWLHDCLEDTDATIQNLRSNFNNRIVSGVVALTKVNGESNEEYYHRLKLNADGTFVKLNGDLLDNFGRNHLIEDDNTRLRMAKKYSLGVDILGRAHA